MFSTKKHWAWRLVAVTMLLGILLASCSTGTPPVTTVVVRETVPVESTRVVKETSVVQITSTAGPTQAVSGSDAILNPDVSGDITFWHFWGSPVRRTAVRRIVSICEQKLPNIHVTEEF